MTKILSVSIAAFNIERFIDNTVESITSSDVIDDMEIIIVNDGSKDKTSQKAHALAEKFPDSIIVVDKENGGYGSTINTSLKIASGKFYKLLDGDDWYCTEHLERYIDFLKKSDADIVITPYYRVGDTECLYDNHQEVKAEKNDINNYMLDSKWFVMHELSVNTDVLRNFGEQITEQRFYTDVEFVCNCFIASRTIARFPNPIYCYRVDNEGQSVSLTGLRKHYQDHPIVTKKVCLTYLKYYNDIEGEKKNVINYWVINLIRNTFVSYMVLKKPKTYKNELIEFDKSIKSLSEELYNLGNESALVRTMRKCKFTPYSMWCKLITRKIK